MSWKRMYTQEMLKPKFVKRETIVMVDARITPKATTIKGKFGEREMYVIETKEFGAVYVSPIQLIHIAQMLEDAFTDKEGKAQPYNDFVSVQL